MNTHEHQTKASLWRRYLTTLGAPGPDDQELEGLRRALGVAEREEDGLFFLVRKHPALLDLAEPAANPAAISERELLLWRKFVTMTRYAGEHGLAPRPEETDALHEELELTPEQAACGQALVERYPGMAALASDYPRHRDLARRSAAALVEFAHAARGRTQVLKEDAS